MPASDPARSSRSEPAEGLMRLSDAFAVSATLGAIGDALIARTHLTSGASDRRAVMDLLAFVVGDPDTLIALEQGDTLPDHVLKRLADLIAIDPPATVPEWEFLQTILEHVRLALHSPGAGGDLDLDGESVPGD